MVSSSQSLNAHLGVDTRVVPLSTTVSPGHNTLQLTVTHNGATRVTLARVLASLQVSSTEHGVSDHARVGVVTIPVGQDGDVQALQLVLVSGGALSATPARDLAHGASGSTAGGQSHGLHVLVEGGGLAQLDQHDVVVDVVGAVPGVTDDTGRADELLGTLVDPDVMLSKTHLNTRLVAVSSRHNPVLVHQGASTEVIARLQRNLMGLGVGCALIPSDDLVVFSGEGSSDEQNEDQRPHGC